MDGVLLTADSLVYPARLATDIGPVIDARAQTRLEEHIAYLDGCATALDRCSLPADLSRGQVIRRWLHEISAGGVVAAVEAELQSLVDCVEDIPGLPGPTGEDNSLFHEPRGTFVVLLATAGNESHSKPGHAKTVIDSDFLAGLLCALLTGNGLLLVDGEEQSPDLLSLLCSSAFPVTGCATAEAGEWLDSLRVTGELAGVIAGPGNPAGRDMVARAREASEAIIPLLSGGVRRHNVHLLVHEKTITENTTASGGDAALMASVGQAVGEPDTD